MALKERIALLSHDFDQAATLRIKVSINLLLIVLVASFIFILSYLLTGQYQLILYIVVPFVLPVLYFLSKIHKSRSYRSIVCMLLYMFTVMGLLNLTSTPDYLTDLFLMPMLIGIAFLVLKHLHALYMSVYLLMLYTVTAAVVQLYEPFEIIYSNDNKVSVVIGFLVSVFSTIIIYFFFARNFQKNSELLGNTLLASQKINDDNKLLISVITHDFRNYLSKLLLQLDSGRKLCKDKSLDQALEGIENSVFEITDLLKEVQNVRDVLMREDQGGMIELSFNAILRKLEMNFRQQLHHRNITMEYESRRDQMLQVYPDIFVHLILANLVSNALRYANSGSAIRFELEKQNGMESLEISYQSSIKHQKSLQTIVKNKSKDSFQLAETDSTKEQGLGILIVRKFCEIHEIEFSIQLSNRTSEEPDQVRKDNKENDGDLWVKFLLEFT